MVAAVGYEEATKCSETKNLREEEQYMVTFRQAAV